MLAVPTHDRIPLAKPAITSNNSFAIDCTLISVLLFNVPLV